MLRGLLDLTLPQTCAACQTPIPGGEGMVCAACDAACRAILTTPYCPRCGRTIPPAAIHPEGCSDCASETLWTFGGVARVGVYDGPLRRLLLDLKYGGGQRNAVYLGGLLAEAVRAAPWAGELDTVVPVPMHWLRRLQRPCDHALLLAEVAGASLGLPVVHALVRCRPIPSQVAMPSRASRYQNVRNSIAARLTIRQRLTGHGPRGTFEKRRILLVDNLVLSGATAFECAKVLRQLGAAKVYLATVGRPAGPGDPPRFLRPLYT